jgi:hypothetical protein
MTMEEIDEEIEAYQREKRAARQDRKTATGLASQPSFSAMSRGSLDAGSAFPGRAPTLRRLILGSSPRMTMPRRHD